METQEKARILGLVEAAIDTWNDIRQPTGITARSTVVSFPGRSILKFEFVGAPTIPDPEASETPVYEGLEELG